MKRKLFLFMTVFCLFSTLFIHADIKYGDINNDAQIGISDLILLAKYMSNKANVSTVNVSASDCFWDGKINGEDLLILIKYIAGEVKELPVGNPASTATTSVTTNTTATSPTASVTSTTTKSTTATSTTTAVASTTTTTATFTSTTTTTATFTSTTTKTTTASAPPTATTTGVTDKSDYEMQVVILVNEERAKEGLPPLKCAVRLDNAADIRVNEQITLFSHTRPDGSSWFTVFEQTGIDYYSAAENIAQGQKTPQEVVDAWMNSDGHRANILDPDFTHIGVGFAENSWVQLFVDADLTDEYSPSAVITTTTTLNYTTTTVYETTTTTVAVSQVDIYRHVNGSWFEAALQVIDERAGLTLNKNTSVSIGITPISGTILAQANGTFNSVSSSATRFDIDFNNYYVDYDTIIPNIDGLMPEFSAIMPMDTVFAHEVTHGLCYMNMTYSTLMSIPEWYFEGICESVIGNNRLYDYPPDDNYSMKWGNTSYTGVQTWEIAHDMIAALKETTADTSIYYTGYLLCSWLDNYGSYAGEFTADNGGRIKDLNSALSRGLTFSNACKAVFGKTSAELLGEFKAASAAVNNYDEWVLWLDEDLNIQCNDGLQDALCNIDAPLTDIVPNLGEPKDISENDVIEYKGVYITLNWIF